MLNKFNRHHVFELWHRRKTPEELVSQKSASDKTKMTLLKVSCFAS